MGSFPFSQWQGFTRRCSPRFGAHSWPTLYVECFRKEVNSEVIRSPDDANQG